MAAKSWSSVVLKRSVLLSILLFSFFLGAAGPANASGGLFEALFGAPERAPTVYAPRQHSSSVVANHRRHRHSRHYVHHKAKRLAHFATYRMLDLGPLAKNDGAKAQFDASGENRGLVDAAAPKIIAAVYNPCCANAQQAIEMVVHDETLRPGDAYMAADGVHIYMGRTREDSAGGHFVGLNQAGRLKDGLRARLTELENHNGGALTANGKAASSAEARNTAAALRVEAVNRAKDPFIVDPLGRKVRFVGGYAGSSVLNH